MKRVAFLLALATTLALAVVAAAAPPPVDAEAYVVQNSGTGEVLASQNEREQLPMASITKLMTAIVALEHASLDDVATISSRTASVGESTINLRPGERVTVGRADSGRADPERERCRECDRGLRRTGLGRPVRRADERTRAGSSA